MNTEFVRSVRSGPETSGPVLYWMSRDQRARDNRALAHAQTLALEFRKPLAVVFCLAPGFLGAGRRHYDFMLDGLRQVEPVLKARNIPFFVLSGAPSEVLPPFLEREGAGTLVTDFDPLRTKRIWVEKVARRIRIRFDQVDAHNVVPCWAASGKQEWAARTFRPKINRLLPSHLEPIPEIIHHPFEWKSPVPSVDWDALRNHTPSDSVAFPVRGIDPGEKAAETVFRKFLEEGLPMYALRRNDPLARAVSGLSPYLHFGQIASMRVVTVLRSLRKHKSSVDAFLEEFVVRRELADNFCFFNDKYDSFEGFPAWARKTLSEHASDARLYRYGFDELENARTHDRLWNAGQTEMVKTGKMHGYMRMYWAKKILEWTESPEQALDFAVRLNDRWELDGRDPNGYTGIAWSIGGVHDRPWAERPVFGKVRYMSERACRSKFDLEAYIRMVEAIET